jgi:hypothetical protein
LSACSNTSKQPIPATSIQIIQPETPRPVNTRPVDFTVVTADSLNKLEDNPVWYAITPKSYENLAYNIQEMIRYISQQQAQINYYKNVTAN